MTDSEITEEEVLHALHDFGMNEENCQKFMSHFRAGEIAYEKRLLLSLRSEILTTIHAGQEKMYRLDFLINKLKLK